MFFCHTLADCLLGGDSVLCNVDARTEGRFLSNHGVWVLDEEIERLGLFRQCPEAREVRRAQHTLLGAKERHGAATIV